MANTKWPFKDMAIGDTVTIYGHPPERVSSAAKAYAQECARRAAIRNPKHYGEKVSHGCPRTISRC